MSLTSDIHSYLLPSQDVSDQLHFGKVLLLMVLWIWLLPTGVFSSAEIEEALHHFGFVTGFEGKVSFIFMTQIQPKPGKS